MREDDRSNMDSGGRTFIRQGFTWQKVPKHPNPVNILYIYQFEFITKQCILCTKYLEENILMIKIDNFQTI